MAKAIEDNITYLKSSNFLRTWSEQQGRPCELEHVKLSTSRSPPRVIHAPPAQSVPARTEREVAPRKQKEPQDPWLNLFNAGIKAAEKVQAFSAWMDSPPPPPTPKATSALPAPKPVPPFDIQDVPKAMRKLGMPMAAKLQERWFAGAANHSRSKQDLKDEIDQNGVRYTAA